MPAPAADGRGRTGAAGRTARGPGGLPGRRRTRPV